MLGVGVDRQGAVTFSLVVRGEGTSAGPESSTESSATEPCAEVIERIGAASGKGLEARPDLSVPATEGPRLPSDLPPVTLCIASDACCGGSCTPVLDASEVV